MKSEEIADRMITALQKALELRGQIIAALVILIVILGLYLILVAWRLRKTRSAVTLYVQQQNGSLEDVETELHAYTMLLVIPGICLVIGGAILGVVMMVTGI